MHAAAFGIYMISSVVYVIIFSISAYSSIHYKYDYIDMADNFSIICSSIVQSIICYIFLNIDNIVKPTFRGVPQYVSIQVEEAGPAARPSMWSSWAGSAVYEQFLEHRGGSEMFY